MFLFRKKIKGLSLRNPLGDSTEIPEGMQSFEVESLVPSLKNGDLEAINTLILGHLRLAINIASQYAKQAPNKSSDLVSEAVLSLSDACHKASRGELKDDNLTAFVVSRIHSNLVNFLRKDLTLRVPHSTLYSHRRSGKNTAVLQRVPLIEGTARSQNRKASLEFLEILELSTSTDFERQVVALRIQSHNDREIAEMLNTNISRVSKARALVESRFDRLTRGK